MCLARVARRWSVLSRGDHQPAIRPAMVLLGSLSTVRPLRDLGVTVITADGSGLRNKFCLGQLWPLVGQQPRSLRHSLCQFQKTHG